MDISDVERAVLDEIGSPPKADYLDRPEGFEDHELPRQPRPRVFRPRWVMEATFGTAAIQAMIDRDLLSSWPIYTPAETRIGQDRDGKFAPFVLTARRKPFLTLTSLSAELLGVELGDRGWRYRRPLKLREPIRQTSHPNTPLPIPLPNLIPAPKDRDWYSDELPVPKKLPRAKSAKARRRAAKGRKAAG